MSHNLKFPPIRRNIIFFGEVGTGKSSAINLILGTTAAPTTNDAKPCTQVSAYYEATLNGAKYYLWDTRGLNEPKNVLQSIFGESSQKALKKFLGERHRKHEIDLLVFCVRGSRATKASVQYYRSFCDITRRLAAPVALMVTLEQEVDMERWWSTNSFRFDKLKMEFDDHVCITTLPDDPRSNESKESLIGMVTKDHTWETNGRGSYFGSRIPRPSFPQPRKGVGRSLFHTIFKGDVDDKHFLDRPSDPGPPLRSNSNRGTAADSPRGSALPSPIVESPSTERPRINTDSFSPGIRPQQPIREESSGTSSSSPSLLSPSPQTSSTSPSEVHTQFGADNHDPMHELPFEILADNVRRRDSYAIRGGAYGDIWRCDLILPWQLPCAVAVKAVKTSIDHEKREPHQRKFDRELKIWKGLKHRNVVPLLGVVRGFGPLPGMVSPWFCHGSLSHFLKHHQTSMSTKNRLLCDIATGLCYLHDQDIVHGDLHSDNVLISEHGTACLTDFGLSFSNEFVDTSYLTSSICGLVHFADPALVQRAESQSPDVIYPTKPCDMYSFGGLILYVMSGKKPYDGIPKVIQFVVNGGRPGIPAHDTNIPQLHRSMIQMCWDDEESNRPLAKDLVMRLLDQE